MNHRIRSIGTGPKRGNELIETPCEESNMDGAVECQERLGGVLKYYRRAA